MARSALAATRAAPGTAQTAQPRHRGLPRWPMAWLLAGFPVWWLLGLGEFVWPLAAAVMVVLLSTVKRVSVPRGFGVWLLFLLWVVASLTQIDTIGRMAGGVYRVGMYASALVIFVYVWNARQQLGRRYLLGLLTAFFAWMVAGGYLGLAFPTGTWRTPLAYLLPGGLLGNELVHQMVVRPFTQYNPDAWTVIDPRPSAPFLYTNNWGNAYSLLLPLVILYLREVRGTKRFWAVAALVPVSLVPAFLTLNRGMFIGLGIAGLYIAVRFAAMGHVRALAWMGALAFVAVVAVQALPVMDRLSSRLESSGTNDSRLGIYGQSISEVTRSPFLGYGAPRPATGLSEYSPSLGTQGQVWMVLFSHGFVGIALFLGGLGWLIWATWRRHDIVGVVLHTTVVVCTVEAFYYGLLGAGLAIAMLAAALAMRGDGPADIPGPGTHTGLEART